MFPTLFADPPNRAGFEQKIVRFLRVSKWAKWLAEKMHLC
jgi:hypothetical protein